MDGNCARSSITALIDNSLAIHFNQEQEYYKNSCERISINDDNDFRLPK